MTEIKIRQDGGIFYLLMSGHSGYAKRGSDIVCASLSTIQYMFIKWCEDNTRAAEVIRYAEAPGEVYMEIGIKDLVFFVAFDFMMNGFAALAERYPENVKITIDE